jgi:predicted MFS family arabinose efflux permease
MAAITAEAHPAVSPSRWYALALLTALYTLNSIDRNVISIVAEPIKAEHHLSDSQVGLLIGLVYAMSFTVAGLPLGLLVDRVNRVRMAAVVLAVWSTLTFFSGFAQSFGQLVAARIGLAAAESGASPTCMSLIADLFPKEQRSSALGWFYFSTPIGLAAGFAIGGLVVAHFGWRAAFLVAGVPGLLLALLLTLTVREPARGAFERQETATLQRSSPHALAALLRARPTMLFLMLAAMVQTAAQAGVGAFLAPFLIRVHHVPIAQVGLLVAAALGGGSAIGIPLGGWLGDRLAKGSATRPLRLVALAMALAGPCAMLAFNAPTAVAAAALAGLYSVLLATYYGSTFSTYLSLAPAGMRGAAGALLTVGLTLVGYGLGPPTAGLLSDTFAHAGATQPLRWALTTLMSLYFGSAGLFLLAARTIKRDLAQAI